MFGWWCWWRWRGLEAEYGGLGWGCSPWPQRAVQLGVWGPATHVLATPRRPSGHFQAGVGDGSSPPRLPAFPKLRSPPRAARSATSNVHFLHYTETFTTTNIQEITLELTTKVLSTEPTYLAKQKQKTEDEAYRDCLES